VSRPVLTPKVAFCLAAALVPGTGRGEPVTADELPPVSAGDMVPVTFPELWINGTSTGEFVRVEQVPDALDNVAHYLLDAADLKARGLALAPGEVDAQGRVALWRLSDIGVVYDKAVERLRLTAPLSRLTLNRINAEPGARQAQAASRGLLLNYDLLAQTTRADNAGRRQQQAGFAELRWFGAHGYLTQTAAARAGTDDRAEVTRLDTFWRYSSPDQLWTVQVGDNIAAGTDSQSAYRFGGLQWRRNFALRPDLVTFPVPLIRGSSAVPATVDVLLDNIRQYSRDVPAGPFEIDNIPFSTTAGDMRVVVRDVLGREQSAIVPLYSVISLLRPGLLDFAVQTGFRRLDYAARSNDYASRPVASGAVRYGVSTRLTVEAYGEGGDGLGMAGLSAAAALGRWSTVSVSSAGSRDTSGASALRGRRDRLAWQYQSNDGWSFNASSLRLRGDFRDIASRDSLLSTRRLDQVGGGVSLGRHGSLAANLISSEQAGNGRERFINASWSRALGAQWHAFVAWNKGLRGSDSNTVFVGLSWYPTVRMGVDASVNMTRGAPTTYSLGVSQRRSGETGLDWALRTRGGGGDDTQQADARYRGAYGETGVQMETTSDSDSLRVQHGGSLVLMGRGLHAGRRIDQSFAVVDVALPGVPVLVENRVVGRTRGNGQLLVTDLRPYQRNRIGIDAIDMPAGYVVRDTTLDVVPPEQVGVHVSFPVREPQAALLRFLDERGQPLPVGAQGSLADGRRFVVGYDGEAYLEDVLGEQSATLIYEQTRCVAALNIPQGGLARRESLPAVTCRVRAPAQEEGP